MSPDGSPRDLGNLATVMPYFHQGADARLRARKSGPLKIFQTCSLFNGMRLPKHMSRSRHPVPARATTPS